MINTLEISKEPKLTNTNNELKLISFSDVAEKEEKNTLYVNHNNKNMSDYPNQDEAQAMLDWFNGAQRVNTGYAGISEQLQEAFKQAESIRENEWQRIFGDNSPWRAVSNGNIYTLEWDEDKASRLNLPN